MAYWEDKPIELSYVYTDVFNKFQKHRFSKIKRGGRFMLVTLSELLKDAKEKSMR